MKAPGLTPAPFLDRVQITGVGTAFPETAYTQEEMTKLFNFEHPVVKKLLKAKHIHKRHLYLPQPDPGTGQIPEETPAMLHRKFKNGVFDIGLKALLQALEDAQVCASQVDYLLCVTSSGFASPGVSSMMTRSLPFRPNVHRLDVVGMGCNAGMSALFQLAQWAEAHPGQNGVLLCCEVNSASYVKDATVRTGIVNSLFGDGAAAMVVGPREKTSVLDHSGSSPQRLVPPTLKVIDFESHVINEQWDAMRFDWDEMQSKWSFYLSPEIPFVVGRSVGLPVHRLLERHNLSVSNIDHWVVHTGGGAVIKGIQKTLGLSDYKMRHTISVLKDYGNLSSGSFIVSLQRLIDEGSVRSGDRGVFIAMGPGATIETSLVNWQGPL